MRCVTSNDLVFAYRGPEESTHAPFATQWFDSDGNGLYNQYSESTWDAHDRLLRFENDNTGDGMADYITELDVSCE